jgi:glycosyltransferase involved in cell wall biosynthesis
MRIGIDVHVLNGPAQGSASLLVSLLRSLPPKHDYFLYSFAPDETRALFPESHFSHRRIPLRQPHLRIQLLYPLLARRDRCDVFHAQYYGPLVGVPGLVLTIHDVIYLDFPAFAPGARRWQARTLGRLCARVARQIITDSHYCKERIVYHYGVPADRVTVIYGGLDHTWLEPDRQAIARAWSDLRHRVPARYLLTVGRMDPRKNFVLAARVTSRLHKLGLTDGLVLVGPDDFGAPALQTQLQREGLDGLVVRLSDLAPAQIQALYQNAQCLLFLSLAEGFGLPPVEAMAMGAPVIASNRTSVPEVCGEGAVILDPNDEAAVAAAARRILSDSGYRAALVARGQARVRAFRAAAMTEQVLEVYRKAAGQ